MGIRSMNLRKAADVAVLLAIGFCIGGMFSDVSAADQYLSEWQTLIAGCLAVIAAAWTVGEMRRNDTMQQKRHEELMQLNLRTDRLRARRAAFPYSIQLASVGERLDSHKADGFDELDANEKQNAIAIMQQCRSKIEEVLDEPSIVDAQGMFGSDMAFTYKLLRDGLGRMTLSSSISSFAGYGDPAAVNMVEVKNFYRHMSLYAKPLKQFGAQLQILAGHYSPG